MCVCQMIPWATNLSLASMSVSPNSWHFDLPHCTIWRIEFSREKSQVCRDHQFSSTWTCFGVYRWEGPRHAPHEESSRGDGGGGGEMAGRGDGPFLRIWFLSVGSWLVCSALTMFLHVSAYSVLPNCWNCTIRFCSGKAAVAPKLSAPPTTTGSSMPPLATNAPVAPFIQYERQEKSLTLMHSFNISFFSADILLLAVNPPPDFDSIPSVAFRACPPGIFRAGTLFDG
jgi:hypothetical protein